MNGYLFCFQYDPSKEHEIIFSAYHGLSDFNGLYRFLKAVICRYAIRVKGLPDDYFNSVTRSKIPDRNEWKTEENLNPYEFYARQDAKSSYKPEISGEVFHMSEDVYSLASPYSRHIIITLSKSQFLNAAKSHNTNFVPYLLYITSNAVRDAYETDKNILMVLPADLRKVFKADCITNFTYSLFLPSSLTEHNAPVEEQCRRFRKMINLQRQPENFAALLYSKVQTWKKLNLSPESIILKSRKIISQSPEKAKLLSMTISYPGSIDMPEGADDLFENIRVGVPFGISFLDAQSYRDEMTITSVQRHDSYKIVNAICNRLSYEDYVQRTY